MRNNRPEVLIEKWLPIQQLGIESQRERGASSALPPLYFLHVWWARRPLTVSRAAILASLLPPDVDGKWFLETLGIFGDPVEARRKIEEALRRGERIDNPYEYPRAFTYIPSKDELGNIFSRITAHWGSEEIHVLDSMAGGGSIPFEARRYGFHTHANELNPVAYTILKATLDYPFVFGEGLADEIALWGQNISQAVRQELSQFFPEQDNETVLCYLWARTVTCPECNLTIPLSPNWWLQKEGNPPKGIAVRLIVPKENEGDRCQFEMVNVGRRSDYNPNNGTVSRGTGRCPRCGNTLTGDYIKTEAQEGRMGQQLYALVLKEERGRSFRLPTAEDKQAVEAAERHLAEKLPEWEAKGWAPNEPYPEQSTDPRPLYYGMPTWKDFFSPRQLLSLLTYLEHLQQVKEEIFATEPEVKAKAIATYLAFIFNKCPNYSSLMSRWHPPRQIVAPVFDRHDFSFKWSYAEMNLTVDSLGFDWAVKQVVDSYKGLCRLAGSEGQLSFMRSNDQENRLHLTLNSAANLWEVEDESIHLVCIDPPYYDNVMYAELSDFFYVWQKRTLGDVYPEAFFEELTNKDDEAVANPARFAGVTGARKMAEQDYEAKMGACFAEMHRVLKPEGVLTVMFTHKRVEAWDTLAMALIEAGFEITASWPVHTESQHSLHIAKKNAAESTILLVCRKRVEHAASLSVGQTVSLPTGAWWDDISPEVSRIARQKAIQFQELGLRGVDLYISTFGPVLQIFSQNWPVKDRSGEPIRPDVALNLARRAVTEYRFEQLLHSLTPLSTKWRGAGGEVGQFDPATRWVILAWDIYQAEQFRYDEARKLAISVGEIDLDKDIRTRKKILAKKSNYVVMNNPKQRVKRGQVDPDADEFDSLIDAIHTAMLVYQQDGAQALRRFYDRTGLLRDEGYLSAYEALLNAIPQRREEFATLRDIALALMEDKVEVPEVEQLELFEVEPASEEE